MRETISPGDEVVRRWGSLYGIRGRVRQILKPGSPATNGGRSDYERAVVDWYAGDQKQTTIATRSLVVRHHRLFAER